MEFPILTVSGLPGSGTSTTCELLNEELGWAYINAGKLFRDLSNESEMTLLEFSEHAELDGAIDRELDARMVDWANRVRPIIMEGRLTGWMALRNNLPSLRVWLEADITVRSERIFCRDKDQNTASHISQREESERHRYQMFHDIDLSDLSIYDLVVNTASYSADEVVNQIKQRLSH